MHRWLAVIAGGVALFGAVAAAPAGDEAAPPPAGRGARWVAGISGMHCGQAACVARAEAALAGLPEVAGAVVDFNTKRATLTLKPGASVSRANVSAALKQAGFGLTTLDPLAPRPTP
jgi:hypothetical protein